MFLYMLHYHAYEMLIIGIIGDMLYSTPYALHIPWFTVSIVLLFVCVEFLKKFFIFYSQPL
jgi:hypothetical protein